MVLTVFEKSLDGDLFKNGHDYFLEAKFDFIEVFENINVLKIYFPVVSRAKVATPYLEIRVAPPVLICWHASPTPGKSI